MAMSSRSTVILTRRDVGRLVDIKGAIRAVEKAFKDHAFGRAQMPAKVYIDLKKYDGDFRAMPAYLESADAAALKWVNVHPGNVRKGLPTVMATLILSDPRTGFPLSIMDGTQLTALRTAAAGGVAAKYLARKESQVIGLVGCGAQARTQLQALRALFKVKEVRVWGHEQKFIRRFIKEMRIKGEEMVPAKDIRECVTDADIIVTTTPARKPLVKLSWLKDGVHINAIGADAPGKQELDPAILQQGVVVIDDWSQAAHSGEINVALKKKRITRRKIAASLGEIVAGKKKGRRNGRQITVFDSTGLAIQDVAVARLVYRAARRQKAGRKVRLI